jgi:3-oxoacyl-[acyl-carrier protein] reductase
LVRATTDQLGPIDILVNNAGSLIERVKLLDITEERWVEVMDLNLKSAMLCSQAIAPFMIERKTGANINVVSVAGRNGDGPGGAYAAAKGGQSRLQDRSPRYCRLMAPPLTVFHRA